MLSRSSPTTPTLDSEETALINKPASSSALFKITWKFLPLLFCYNNSQTKQLLLSPALRDMLLTITVSDAQRKKQKNYPKPQDER